MYIILHHDTPSADGATHVIKMGVDIEGLELKPENYRTSIEPVVLGDIFHVKRYVNDVLGWVTKTECAGVFLWDECSKRLGKRPLFSD